MSARSKVGAKRPRRNAHLRTTIIVTLTLLVPGITAIVFFAESRGPLSEMHDPDTASPRIPSAEVSGGGGTSAADPEAHVETGILAAIPDSVPGLDLVERQTVQERPLRGYGTLSGEYVAFTGEDGAPSSCLLIRCQSVEKAKIVHAKYRSDLHLLEGVEAGRIDVAGFNLLVYRVKAQGAILSARSGSEVYIIAARADKDLVALTEATKLAVARDVAFEPTVQVPMYLDTFDKFGFRFYYRPWDTPQGVDPRTYNPLDEFEFAREHGRLGFVFWAKVNPSDTAEGLNNDVWWDWGARAAARRKLPSVINIQLVGASWLSNRYRDETMLKMPQYCGAHHSVASPYMGGMGVISWCSQAGMDNELANLQKIVREYAPEENVIEFLEPHGEPHHGDYDLFLEYGPLADESYRTYLKEKYTDLPTVKRRWGASDLQTWKDVRVPELSSFFGFDEEALDLSGEWRIAHPETSELATAWMDPAFDDSSWATAVAPGHDRTMFLPKKPAVYRRNFDVKDAWREKHPRAWLYVWDLSRDWGKTVSVVLNGALVGESAVIHADSHWCALDVTDVLKAGKNQLALSLPQGYLAYRVYVSSHEPAQYPRLGAHLNARWVDLSDWRGWTRVQAIRRGFEMIRSVDPDRAIPLMAADRYAAELMKVCDEFGGRFHNTGNMSSSWEEAMPMLMRGADMPASLEPGGPAGDLKDFKKFMGLWMTEGVNSVQYFIHIGNVLWDDAIRSHFEKILPIVSTIGKHHQPKSECALLISDRVVNLRGFPWSNDPRVSLPSGYYSWNINEFVPEYPMDALTEADFKGGNADNYRVIIDTNTLIMDESLVDDIEAWVRKGGTFVTFVQTGRHTPTKSDTWPISRLTGYEVTGIDEHAKDGSASTRRIRVAPGQTMMPGLGKILGDGANGLSLRPVAPECRDIVVWEDGAVAAGVRPIGKGFAVHLGFKYSNRVVWWGGRDLTKSLFTYLMDWCKVRKIQARADDGVMLRQYVSNSGIYDVWMMWNRSDKNEIVTDLVFAPGYQPAFCIDAMTGKQVALAKDDAGWRLRELRIPPYEMQMFLTPRGKLESAALSWLTLQRNWWRGTGKGKALPAVEAENALDLTEDWAFKPLEGETGDIARMAAPDFDDAEWKRMRLGVWAVPDELESRHVLFRRRFTVPAGWTKGEIRLWIRSFFANTLLGRMRVWLDGREVKALHPPDTGVEGLRITEDVKAGGTHHLAVEITGEGSLIGPRGNTWLSHVSEPRDRLDLAGKWRPSSDAMNYAEAVDLPGPLEALTARRTVTVPRTASKMNVYFHMDAGARRIGVLVNGTWVRRHHHALGNITHLNITPWVKFGEENEFEVVNWECIGTDPVREVALWFYDR